MNKSPSTQAVQRKFFTLAFLLILLFSWTVIPAQSLSQPVQSYIVQGTTTDLAAKSVLSLGGEISSRLDIIHAVAVSLSPEMAAALRHTAGIVAVSSNSNVLLADKGGANGNDAPATDYPDVVGANVVWDAGVTGQGVTVAVLDTGIANHKGLKRNLEGHPENRVIAWVDFVTGSKDINDQNGHGTHVAGIIANADVGTDGEWDGVAPGAMIAGVRVLDSDGKGTYEHVIQGIQWAIDYKDQYNIRVINLSLVSLVQSPYWADPLNQAVMAAWANGIVVVAAAGNGGPGPLSIGVPGNNPYAITVGAFTDNNTPLDWNDDYIAPFSAAGPTLDGFVKPDLVAPGGHIVSAMMPGARLMHEYPEAKVNNFYFKMAGTSQSAAVASGVAALILSANPQLTPDQVKFRLMQSSFVWLVPQSDPPQALYSIWQQGYGRLNAPDAVLADISGEANAGMDIQADLAGTTHYEGYSYYDAASGLFRLRDENFNSWGSSFGTWSGSFGTWSGSFGTWSGSFGTWSGSFGTWSGSFGTWSGSFGTWSGSFGTWSGSFGTWSGGYEDWTGSVPWAGTYLFDPVFVQNFLDGVVPDTSTTSTSITDWVVEP